MLDLEALRDLLNKEAEKNIDNLTCESMILISQQLDKMIIDNTKNN